MYIRLLVHSVTYYDVSCYGLCMLRVHHVTRSCVMSWLSCYVFTVVLTLLRDRVIRQWSYTLWYMLVDMPAVLRFYVLMVVYIGISNTRTRVRILCCGVKTLGKLFSLYIAPVHSAV